MYPHERSLVEKFKDRPFAIVGINSDGDLKKLRDVMKEKDLTWETFFDGGSTGGPIATKWGVRGWPTLYVIDDQGIIRSSNAPRGERLEKILDELVEKAEQRTGG